MIRERENRKQRESTTQVQRDTRASCLLFSKEEWASISDSLRLCPRELQVVQGVFTDLTEQQIALRLGISRHTIHSYVIRVYRKLDISSRCELLLAVFAEYRRQQSSPVE